MADINYIPDHADRAVALLPSRLRQPVISALVKSIMLEVQALEDGVMDTLSALPVAVAEGIVLDRWGAIVGEARLGLDDATYRRIVWAKLAAAKASSRRDYITGFLIQLFEEERATYSEYIAAFRVNVTSNVLASPALTRRILRLLTLATPAGIHASIAEGPVGVFRFDTDSGFGSLFGRILKA